MPHNKTYQSNVDKLTVTDLYENTQVHLPYTNQWNLDVLFSMCMEMESEQLVRIRMATVWVVSEWNRNRNQIGQLELKTLTMYINTS